MHVAFVLGDPPAAPHATLPIRVASDAGENTIGPFAMRLFGSPPAPAFKAIRRATRAFETCAAANTPASPVVVEVRLLISETGEIARLRATSGTADGEPLARCATKMTWPDPHGRVVGGARAGVRRHESVRRCAPHLRGAAPAISESPRSTACAASRGARERKGSAHVSRGEGGADVESRGRRLG